ncbi:hypothetical protein ASD02_11040 [Ensifer sp. Root1252]|nr:hypothetical protein ASD02_11040 [Ensifer sp. Root1252]KRC74673.1 hypothetical protein ASE32_07125 [Ensifer sp. Root231]KRC94759.1 hypothetical protein ASE47_08115 [Ensifer sp. Root258]
MERLASSRDKNIFGRVWFLSRLMSAGGGKLRSIDLQQAATQPDFAHCPNVRQQVWMTIKMQSSFTSGTYGFALRV